MWCAHRSFINLAMSLDTVRRPRMGRSRSSLTPKDSQLMRVNEILDLITLMLNKIEHRRDQVQGFGLVRMEDLKKGASPGRGVCMPDSGRGRSQRTATARESP
jgi:hypothetical protein